MKETNTNLEYIQKMLEILNHLRDVKSQREFLEILRESQHKMAVIDQYYDLIKER